MFGSQRNVSDGGRGVELHKRPEKRGVCSVAAEYTTSTLGDVHMRSQESALILIRLHDLLFPLYPVKGFLGLPYIALALSHSSSAIRAST